MVNIIKSKNLDTMETTRMLSNLVLSIVDEINEFNEYVLKTYKVTNNEMNLISLGEYIDSKKDIVEHYEDISLNYYLNSVYELIDIIHFIVQVQLVSMSIVTSIEHFDGEQLKTMTREFFDDETVTNKILYEVYEKIDELEPLFNTEFDSLIHSEGQHFTNNLNRINDIIFMRLSKNEISDITMNLVNMVSKLLENIEWKHWKTYDKNEEVVLKKNKQLFVESTKMLSYVFKILKYNFGLSMKDITLIYISKNLENIDRQKRNY